MSTTTPYEDGDKLFLFLAYFGIFSIIPFVMFKSQKDDPKKEYVYWHAAQGLAFTVFVIALEILLMVLGVVLAILHLGFLSMILGLVVMVVVLGGMILGWLKAFQGDKWEMPVVGAIAKMIRG